MTAENALDPPPFRRRSGRAPYPRLAAIVAAVVVVAALVFAISQIVLKHPAAPTPEAGAQRGAASSVVQPPPAVSAKETAQAAANLRAQQQAANAPALAVHPEQVASVSPPAGPPPRGPGVTRSKASIDPSAS